ncbi:MAG: VWD domain-containing protein [Acidobacteriota bacterium]
MQLARYRSKLSFLPALLCACLSLAFSPPPAEARQLEITPSNLLFTHSGQRASISVHLVEDDGTILPATGALTWSSSDPAMQVMGGFTQDTATVTAQTTVGSAMITATLDDGSDIYQTSIVATVAPPRRETRMIDRSWIVDDGNLGDNRLTLVVNRTTRTVAVGDVLVAPAISQEQPGLLARVEGVSPGLTQILVTFRVASLGEAFESFSVHAVSDPLRMTETLTLEDDGSITGTLRSASGGLGFNCDGSVSLANIGLSGGTITRDVDVRAHAILERDGLTVLHFALFAEVYAHTEFNGPKATIRSMAPGGSWTCTKDLGEAGVPVTYLGPITLEAELEPKLEVVGSIGANNGNVTIKTPTFSRTYDGRFGFEYDGAEWHQIKVVNGQTEASGWELQQDDLFDLNFGVNGSLILKLGTDVTLIGALGLDANLVKAQFGGGLNATIPIEAVTHEAPDPDYRSIQWALDFNTSIFLSPEISGEGMSDFLWAMFSNEPGSPPPFISLSFELIKKSWTIFSSHDPAVNASHTQVPVGSPITFDTLLPATYEGDAYEVYAMQGFHDILIGSGTIDALGRGQATWIPTTDQVGDYEVVFLVDDALPVPTQSKDAVSVKVWADLMVDPYELVLETEPDGTAEGQVRLINPSDIDMTYSVAPVEPWLSVASDASGTVSAESTEHIDFTGACSGLEETKSGSYELTTASGVETYPVRLTCANYQIDPRVLSIQAELKEDASGSIEIRNLAPEALDYEFDAVSGVTLSSTHGTIAGTDSATITVTSTCTFYPDVDTFHVPVTIAGLADSVEIVRNCVDSFDPELGHGAGQTTGDPHLETIDGVRFDYQGVGEYILLRSTDTTDEFEVQVRTAQLPDREVAVNSAVAARVGTDRVAFYTGSTPLLKIDGTITEIPSGGSHELPAGGIIERVGNSYLVRWPDGESYLKVDQTNTWSMRYLNLTLRPGSEIAATEGLLAPGGPADPSYSAVLDWGDTFRVFHGGAASSLFDYATGEGPGDFDDATFPSAPISLASFDFETVVWAQGICIDQGVLDPTLFDACTLDVAATGDPQAAEGVLTMQDAGLRSVYFEDFQGTVGTEWSLNPTGTFPADPSNRFLGTFTNDEVTFTLPGLEDHTRVTVVFDLHIIGEWDGRVWPFSSDDHWGMQPAGGDLIHYIFSNRTNPRQSYPDVAGAGHSWPRWTGAVSVEAMDAGEATYRIIRTFPHTAGTFIIDLEGWELHSSEQWAIDNFEILLSGGTPSP